jgi:predicted enzyme related to lactoylglutathione lyase
MIPRKVTPIFFVDRSEPSLDFWRKLGWKVTVEVPHGEGLGFVILSSGEHELMFQSQGSLAEDLPSVSTLATSRALYMDVPSIAAALKDCKGARVLVRERETPYGAREAWVVDPAGVVVGFAEHPGKP